jgi:hypothetical protein
MTACFLRENQPGKPDVSGLKADIAGQKQIFRKKGGLGRRIQV